MPEIDPFEPHEGPEPGGDPRLPIPDPVFPGGGGEEGPGGGGFDPGRGGLDPERGGGGFDPVEPPPSDNPDRPNAPPDRNGNDGRGGDEPPNDGNDDNNDDPSTVHFHEGDNEDNGLSNVKGEISSRVQENKSEASKPDSKSESYYIDIEPAVSSSGRPSDGGVLVEGSAAVGEAASNSLISRLFHSTGFRYFSRLASVAATVNGVVMMTIHTAGGAFDPDDIAFTAVGTVLAIHEYIQWVKDPKEGDNASGAHPRLLAHNLKSKLAHGTHASALQTFATIDSAEDNAPAAPIGAIDYWAITVAAGRPLNEASVARWIVAASDRRGAGIQLSEVTTQMARDVWNGVIAWYATSEAEFWTNYRPDVPVGEDNIGDNVLAQIVTLETYKDMAARDETLSPTFKWRKVADAIGLRDSLVDLYSNSGAAAVYDHMAQYEYQGAPLSRKVACDVVLAALGQVYLNSA